MLGTDVGYHFLLFVKSEGMLTTRVDTDEIFGATMINDFLDVGVDDLNGCDFRGLDVVLLRSLFQAR
jgi:hypothetical protein